MKLLVANRGEVAIRILNAARDLNIPTVAVYSVDEDDTHLPYATEAIKLEGGAEAFLDYEQITNVAKQSKITHVHPGYGFLSESGIFSKNLSENGISFIGPSIDILTVAGDKLVCREKALQSNQPVVPGHKVNDTTDIQSFVKKHGFPVMLKALDGGGGRGIRLVETPEEIESSFKRCIGESPSGQIFIERALINGWKHVEIQIAGDQNSCVIDLGDRECSVQRRFQKLVEMAPSTLPSSLSQGIINSAKEFARNLRYVFLGTFEYLANAKTNEFYFLEINPRLQVEHTVTEEATGIDLVALQLLLSQGNTFHDMGLIKENETTTSIPRKYTSIQARITAEKVEKDFGLSLGEISSVSFPSGPGVRVDSWINVAGSAPKVTPYFDSLLAKVIVTAPNIEICTQRAIRALQETHIHGIDTNNNLLIAILAEPDLRNGSIDTLWLERNLNRLLELTGPLKEENEKRLASRKKSTKSKSHDDGSGSGAGSILLAPDTTFDLRFTDANSSGASKVQSLTLSTISRNQLPFELAGDMVLQGSSDKSPVSFSIKQRMGAGNSAGEMGDPADPSHITSPTGGQIISLSPNLVANGKVVKGEELLVVTVMKMETVIRADRDGKILRVGGGIKVGEIIAEGTLVGQWETPDQTRSKL